MVFKHPLRQNEFKEKLNKIEKKKTSMCSLGNQNPQEWSETLLEIV